MRILLIASTLPWPLEKSGAAQRSGLLLQALQSWGDVDVLVAAERPYFERHDVREKMRAPRKYAIAELDLDFKLEAAPWSRFTPLVRGKLQSLLRDLGRCKADFTVEEAKLESLRRIVQDGRYDVVVVRHLRWAMKTGAAFLPSTTVLLDYDDIDWHLHRSREEQAEERSAAKRLRDKIVGRYLEHTARKCLRHFAHVWAASEEDRKELGLRHCSVLPNVPLLPPVTQREPLQHVPRRDSILFVATLTYGPNVSGLDHFLTKIWPQIHQASPDVRLKVVGKLPQDLHRVNVWKQVPNVDLLGFVEDLGESYDQALFTIAPIYWGGGTKIKVLESLGRSRTCVATRHALYGLEIYVRHEDSLLRADTDGQFVECCLRLLSSSELRERLETRGVDVIRQHFSESRFNSVVAGVLRTLPPATHQGGT